MRNWFATSSISIAVLFLTAETRAGTDAVSGTAVNLGASDWNGIRAAHEVGRRAVFAERDGHVARSSSQSWNARFDGRGFEVEPDGAAWRFGLELERWGFADDERAIEARSAGCAEDERIEFERCAELTEWYVNGSDGLEHGYTVHCAPSASSGPLLLTLAVRGGLEARLATDLRGASFLDANGTTRVTYTGLRAFDADGMELDARFELVPHGLRFVVDVEGARYPITIDPLAQQGYLKASNTGVDDGFGYAVAVSGDTIVVGAWNEDSSAAGVNGNQSDNSVSNAGAAYVFVRNGTTWSQQAYLKASNPDVGDEFGYPVGISGDTIVVGARLESSDATGVNGAQNNNNASLSGAAYVFVRNGTTWSQQAYLKASNSEANDVFGSTVAISGDTVVVGTASERSNATGVNGNQADNSLVGAGAAYVFARSGTTWSQQAYLKASNTGSIDQFGHSLAISGDTIAVGAVGEASNATGVNGNQLDNSASGSGAVYVFARSGTTWSQQAYVKASNPDVGDTFGRSVAVSGSTLVVGAEGESSNATGVNGNQANNASGRSGAAYVFVRNGTTWSQQAYLKASNNGLQDEFGGSVAASGDLVLVGAVGEGSNATGVNGNQLDNSLFAAGAAYLFTRSGTTWSQHSYLKASNTASSDTFGVRVAIDGTTCVIGAFGEDSNATGVNGNQASNSASGSGAAYTHFLDDGPVVFCAGDGSGVPCPCAASLAGNGCPNNVNAGGAHLSATGTASLGIDSLVLHGTGMNNGPCFYFQGDARENGGLGVVFGDGIRCVTGNVIAFPAKLNVLGASQYPGLGDASISIAGAVGVPGQKHYQCVYRSANPSFCTPSTLNYTNALSVTWGL